MNRGCSTSKNGLGAGAFRGSRAAANVVVKCEILAEDINCEGAVHMAVRTYIEVTPSAARLTNSLRDIGYDFPEAVADIVDNSIAAGASQIQIEFEFDGWNSIVMIADDGAGMTWTGVNEALRFGSRRTNTESDLGRYGLGLKTASLSQCRSVMVASRRAGSNRTTIRQLDLDVIEDYDQWLVTDPGPSYAALRARELLAEGMNTVVVWEALDRVLPETNTDGGWARRRMDSARLKTIDHLAMVFHRFLTPADTREPVDIIVNGEKVLPWDPFATDEPNTVELGTQLFELNVGEFGGPVRLMRYVLPSRDAFSSPGQFERHAGPQKWNRQQGLYIYRADRLVQWGGWSGVRAIDEHTKLARAALDFGTELDPVFNINVAKMRVSVPPQLRQMLERPINELCSRADAAYRKTSRTSTRTAAMIGGPSLAGPSEARSSDGRAPETRSFTGTAKTSLAIRSAALQVGEYEALRRIAGALVETAPEIARLLGLETI